MPTTTWNSNTSDPTDTGDLNSGGNYVGGAKAAAAADLRFDPSGNRAVTAGLNAYVAVNLGRIIVDGFVANIGASDEFLQALSSTKIKHEGFGKVYIETDAPEVICYDTGPSGELHLQSDGSATPVQDFNVIHALVGQVFIDNGALNPTKISEINVYAGAQVTIAAGVVSLSGAKIVFHKGGVVIDSAGGAKSIEGSGGTYRLSGAASLSAATARPLSVVFDHQSSGDAGDLDILGGGKLITINNSLSGTAGAVRRFPGGVHDLADVASGVTATSVVDVVETIGA